MYRFCLIIHVSSSCTCSHEPRGCETEIDTVTSKVGNVRTWRIVRFCDFDLEHGSLPNVC
jgi:hypothetical protein